MNEDIVSFQTEKNFFVHREKQSEESLPHIFGNIFCCQVLTNITHLAAAVPI